MPDPLDRAVTAIGSTVGALVPRPRSARDPRNPGLRLATHDEASPAAAAPPLAGVDESYAAVAASVVDARAALSRWLRSQATDDLVVAEVALAVTEACTNVAVHAYRNGPQGSFRVVADVVGGAVRVTVSDQGRGMAPRPDSPGLGLGLLLMRSCSDSLDIRPTGNGTGTTITMSFTAAGASERYAGGH